jgi:signal transduction histidine kinase
MSFSANSMHGKADAPTELDSARSEAAAEGLEGRQAGELSVSSPQMRDLAALLALPRLWRNRDSQFIAAGMLDVLVSLLRSDVAYAKLVCDGGKETFEFARPAKKLPAEELGRLLGASPESGTSTVDTMPDPMGTGLVRLLRVSAGFEDQQAHVVVGSSRADFPTHIESFLCRVAVEQAMLAVQASRLVAGLTTANKAKATFLATMSHELRTPLNAVVGYSELLLAGIGGELKPQQEQYVDRIERAARHLMGLIEGILSFARLEAGKEQVTITDVDVGKLADEVIAMIEPLAKARALTLNASTQHALPSESPPPSWNRFSSHSSRPLTRRRAVHPAPGLVSPSRGSSRACWAER